MTLHMTRPFYEWLLKPCTDACINAFSFWSSCKFPRIPVHPIGHRGVQLPQWSISKTINTIIAMVLLRNSQSQTKVEDFQWTCSGGHSLAYSSPSCWNRGWRPMKYIKSCAMLRSIRHFASEGTRLAQLTWCRSFPFSSRPSFWALLL